MSDKRGTSTARLKHPQPEAQGARRVQGSFKSSLGLSNLWRGFFDSFHKKSARYRKESVGPETKNRAPGAEIFARIWRPAAAIVIAASAAAVYYENRDARNSEQNSTAENHQVLSANEIQALKGSLSIAELSPTPTVIKLTPTVTPQPEIPDNSRVQASSIETQSDHEEVRGWLISAGWPEELFNQALEVIKCESTYNPSAVSPNNLYYGLFGLDKMWFGYAGEDPGKWADPVINAKVAYKTYLYDLEVGNPPWYQWDPTCRP